MKLLITQEVYNKTKSRALVPIECEECHLIFYKPKHKTQARKYRFCSHICHNLSKTTKKYLECVVCGKHYYRVPSQILKSSNSFCSHACVAYYNNTHKTYGTQRSKLEVYLEQQIEQHYPQLHCLYNNKEVIGSELDFYFPTLRLAIELNGITHYEPIYGTDRLEKSQNNDKQKAIKCNELGIEFCSVDSSACSHLNQKQKDKYWALVKDIIDSIIQRHYIKL